MPAEPTPPVRPRRQMSARLRLTLSYAVFLVVAGSVALFGFYMALHLGLGFKLQSADITSRGELRDAMLVAAAAALLGLAAVGLGGGWLLAGWILRPLDDINQAARIAATGRLDHRIRLTGRSDEFGQLADNFDHMLERLHDAFLNQERFAANASHELRTPLAVTATMLDVARTDPEGRYDPALLERLQLTNDRAIELTEALLRLSDANAVTAVSEPVDLAALVGGAVEELEAEAERRHVQLHAKLEAAPSVGDPALLRQLVGNLAENAVRHNRPEGEAWLATHIDAVSSRAVVQVENTGPSYTEETAAQLVQPFLRGAGRTAAQNGDRGYGLGLALVARIVNVHDGELTISPRPGGGLIVTVALPPPAYRR